MRGSSVRNRFASAENHSTNERFSRGLTKVKLSPSPTGRANYDEQCRIHYVTSSINLSERIRGATQLHYPSLFLSLPLSRLPRVPSTEQGGIYQREAYRSRAHDTVIIVKVSW